MTITPELKRQLMPPLSYERRLEGFLTDWLRFMTFPWRAYVQK